MAGGDDGHVTTTTFVDTATAFNWGSVSSVKRDAWVRFTSVTIAQGSTVSAAIIDYYSNGTFSGTTCNATIYCNDEDDAAAPTDRLDYEAKSVTTANTAWNSIPTHSTGTNYQTADFTSAAQEVLDRAGWVSGNAMMVLIKNNGSSASAFRGAASLENTTYTEPYLNITYTAPAKSPPPLSQSTKRPYQYLLSM